MAAGAACTKPKHIQLVGTLHSPKLFNFKYNDVSVHICEHCQHILYTQSKEKIFCNRDKNDIGCVCKCGNIVLEGLKGGFAEALLGCICTYGMVFVGQKFQDLCSNLTKIKSRWINQL